MSNKTTTASGTGISGKDLLAAKSGEFRIGARALINRGYEVTAAGRRLSLPINLAGLAIKYVPGDIDRPGQIDRWVEGHDVVVDAAAPYPSLLMPRGESAAASLEQAGRRTRMLVDAVRQQHARLAYVSTFATLPDRSTGLQRIQREWIRRLHPYFAVKERIEAEIMAAARTGLPAVIVNPTLCIGPWDIKARDLCFVPRLLSGEAPVSVAHSINVIDVRDMAAGLVAALERDRWGEPILLAGHNISAEALYTWICEIGGVMPPRVVAPITLGMISTYWSELVLGAIGLPPPPPGARTDAYYAARFIRPEPDPIGTRDRAACPLRNLERRNRLVSANWLLLNWTIQAHTREQWLVSNSHLDYTTEYYLPRGLPAIGVVLPIHDARPPTEIRAKRLCHIAAYPKWLDRFKHDVPVTIAIGLLLAAQKPELLDDLHCVELTNDDLEFLLNPVRFDASGNFRSSETRAW